MSGDLSLFGDGAGDGTADSGGGLGSVEFATGAALSDGRTEPGRSAEVVEDIASRAESSAPDPGAQQPTSAKDSTAASTEGEGGAGESDGDQPEGSSNLAVRSGLARPEGVARVLHTSDWHLGVQVKRHSRAPDHDALIDELVDIAQRSSPDLIVHTGDLFDSSRPAMQDFGRAIGALRRLSEVAPVVVLAGNHDSAIVFDVLAMAVQDPTVDDVKSGTYEPYAPSAARVRVHSRPALANKGAVATYASSSGIKIRLAVLPFVHSNRVLREFDDFLNPNAIYADKVRQIADSYEEAIRENFDPSSMVAVFASHLHLHGARTSSEKQVHIATDYATDSAAISEIYGYSAFGHIHVPQAVGRGRYAGSLLEIDFGEEGEQKQVVLADLRVGRPTEVKTVLLTAGRRLRRVSCVLDELPTLAAELQGALVDLTIRRSEAEGPSVTDSFDRVLVGATTYDTLSEAIAAELLGVEVVALTDARRARAVTPTESSAPLTITPIADEFASWLTGKAGSAMLAGKPLADRSSVAQLFEQWAGREASGGTFELDGLGDLDAQIVEIFDDFEVGEPT